MLGLDAVPQVSPGVLLESTAEQSYLYDSQSHSYALLDNAVAIAVVSLCDGTRSIGGICEQISLLYAGCSLEQIQQDVLAMMALLTGESFLRLTAADAQER